MRRRYTHIPVTLFGINRIAVRVRSSLRFVRQTFLNLIKLLAYVDPAWFSRHLSRINRWRIIVQKEGRWERGKGQWRQDFRTSRWRCRLDQPFTIRAKWKSLFVFPSAGFISIYSSTIMTIDCLTACFELEG